MRISKRMGFNIPEFGDVADIRKISENFEKLDDAVDSFGYLMQKYGYKRVTSTNDDGNKVITITIKEGFVGKAEMVVVFSKNPAGDKVVDVTTTVGDVVVKEQHTMNKINGEGGVVNG